MNAHRVTLIRVLLDISVLSVQVLIFDWLRLLTFNLQLGFFVALTVVLSALKVKIATALLVEQKVGHGLWISHFGRLSRRVDVPDAGNRAVLVGLEPVASHFDAWDVRL